jgi:hypothetical protein
LTKIEKKSYFGPFFEKSIFRLFSNFLCSRYLKISFHHFPISQVLNYSFMQKNI